MPKFYGGLNVISVTTGIIVHKSPQWADDFGFIKHLVGIWIMTAKHCILSPLSLSLSLSPSQAFALQA